MWSRCHVDDGGGGGDNGYKHGDDDDDDLAQGGADIMDRLATKFQPVHLQHLIWAALLLYIVVYCFWKSTKNYHIAQMAKKLCVISGLHHLTFWIFPQNWQCLLVMFNNIDNIHWSQVKDIDLLDEDFRCVQLLLLSPLAR